MGCSGSSVSLIRVIILYFYFICACFFFLLLSLLCTQNSLNCACGYIVTKLLPVGFEIGCFGVVVEGGYVQLQNGVSRRRGASGEEEGGGGGAVR